MCVFVCVIFYLSIYLLMDSCFYLLAVVNNADMNIGLQVSVFSFYFPLRLCLGMELLGHMVVLFNLLRNCQTVFTATASLYSPTSNA